MLSTDEFNNRVIENIRTLNFEIETKSFCPSNYHFFEKDRETEKRLFEFENAWDILAATIIGELPSCSRFAQDGYRLVADQYIPMEYKITRKYRNLIWQTPNGSLQTGSANIQNFKTGLRSTLSAHFEIKYNLASKNRPTILFLFDETLQQFVTGFELDGSKIINSLNGSTNKRRTIKLSYFRQNGREIKFVLSKNNMYNYSYLDWETDLRNQVKTVDAGDFYEA